MAEPDFYLTSSDNIDLSRVHACFILHSFYDGPILEAEVSPPVISFEGSQLIKKKRFIINAAVMPPICQGRHYVERAKNEDFIF